MKVTLEFVSSANIRNLQLALDLVDAAGRPNARLAVDLLHAHRSRIGPDELAAVPSDLFSCCACKKEHSGAVRTASKDCPL